MRKLLSVLLVLLMVAVTVSACGGGGGTGSSTPATDTPAENQPESTSVNDSGGTSGGKIAIWMGTEDARFMIDSGLPKKFQEETGYEVEIVELPWDTLHDKILAGISGGELPAVAGGEDMWIGEFSMLGGLLEMDTFREKFGHSDDKYLPNSWDHFRAPDGKIYAAPFYCETRVLFYRTDLFEAAGLKEPPKDFIELLEYGKKLTNGTDQFGMTYLESWLDVHLFTWLLAAKGATIMSDDFSECTLNSPEAIEALEYYATLYNENVIPKDPTKRVEGFKGFREGYYAMAESGAWWFGLLANEGGDIEGKWSAVVLPSDKTTLSYGHPNPWYIPVNAANPNGVNREAGEAWIDFMLRPENALIIHQVASFMPAMKAAYDDPIITGNPNAMALYEANKRGTYSLRNVPNAQMVQETIWNMLADVRDDVKTPKQAAEDVTAAINSIVKG